MKNSQHVSSVKTRSQTRYLLTSIMFFLIPHLAIAQSNTADYSAPLPFLSSSVEPNVVIALDVSGSMKIPAYQDSSAGRWSNSSTVQNDFDPNESYYGYFNSGAKYSYDGTAGNEFFYEDSTGGWDGDFLNWASMRRMDVVRKVLIGGKVENRDGQVYSGHSGKAYVIEGQNEPEDRTFRKKYAGSSALSDGQIPNNAQLLISNGSMIVNNSTGTTAVPVTKSFEVGKVNLSRSISNGGSGDEDSGDTDWITVPFLNTYTNPRVVTTALTFNGGDPTHTRVRNITPTSFEVRLEEWAYKDGNHTTETVTYLVAEEGRHNITVGSNTYLIQAGQITTDSTSTSTINEERVDLSSAFSKWPVVFAGVSTFESDRPVIARVSKIRSSRPLRFEVSLQNEEEKFNDGDHPKEENIDWIAIERGLNGSVSSGGGVYANILTDFTNNVTNSFTNVTFDTTMSSSPILAVGTRTANDTDTAYPRYKNLSTSSFSVMMEEEKSKSPGDNEISHGNETIVYLAVSASNEYKIRIKETELPVGVVQQNADGMRFGLAVYNFNHSWTDTTAIYNNNRIHGGTLAPCYPNVDLDTDLRTNFDICLDTHVKSPIENIIQVIEEYPLIWGSTPIGETLYDIEGYFAQRDNNRNGHTQWYDNGTEGTAGERNSYEISNEWDPYYYDELGATSPCALSYVLHFNDGAPYTDFDGSGHPSIDNDGIGQFGQNEKLDDLALMLRKNDCRAETNDRGEELIPGHQDIISYYVYAALGEEETQSAFNSTRRVQEAAANGGFVDDDGNGKPDVDHPLNFYNYYQAGVGGDGSVGGVCTQNEWDQNGDCTPDTFFFANDGPELVTQLNAAFQSITERSATGGASSVISSSSSGEGAVINAIFQPATVDSGDTAVWTGDVHALFIDDSGALRESSNTTLDVPATDPYIDFCSFVDSDKGSVSVRVKKSTSANDRPSADQAQSCSNSIYNYSLHDINYIWSAADWLAGLTDDQAITQRAYTSTAQGRYIITGIDTNNDSIVQFKSANNEQMDFLSSSFPSTYAGLLADDASTAAKIIDFIRGKDSAGFRSRQLNGETKRLGDIIYSTPTIVGSPSENLTLIYDSVSYRAFFDRYRYRRQVVYTGGNDGMLHAFNAGWYDAATKKQYNKYTSTPSVNAPGSTLNFDLGAEMWAYVPYNTLRHLEYLSDEDYGSTSSDHIYHVDLKPKVFDAKIFTDDTDHPGGWGTIMIVGMRLGGGEVTVDADLSSSTQDTRTLTSSYSIFDITNPDVPPKLLLEYTHPDLGFTTSSPAGITMGTDKEGNGEWYLMIGSGADTDKAGFSTVSSTQNAKLFLLDLKAVAAGDTQILVDSFGTNGIYTLNESNSMISDIVSVDYGLDNFTTDTVYFGTSSGTTGDWSGKIYRVAIQNATGVAQRRVDTWEPSVLYNNDGPITAPISLGTDNNSNRWLYIGTGRYFNSADNLDESQYHYYGLKEPRDSSEDSNPGDFNYSTITNGVIDITSTRVKSTTGELIDPPTLSPALGLNTLSGLKTRMKSYLDKDTATSGWKRNFNYNSIVNYDLDGERNFGGATLLGGTLTFSTYDPDAKTCAVEGQALLYVVDAFTGTAGSPAIIGTEDDSGNTYNTSVIDIGSSPASTPSLHRGDGYASDNSSEAVIQTSDGTIVTVKQTNPEQINDGESSWRQLQ